MLTAMNRAVNRSELASATVLQSGRHKSVEVSALYQDEDDIAHLARNEAIHHNPNRKRVNGSGLGFTKKRRTSDGHTTVHGNALVAPQVSVPMMPQSVTVPQVSAAQGLGFDMQGMLQLCTMQMMMKMFGDSQQPMAAPVQQPTMAPVQQQMMGGNAPVHNGTVSTSAEPEYPIVYPTQEYNDEAEIEADDSEEEEEVEMFDDYGDEEIDESDSE